MERVAQYLRGKAFARALVRLWVIGSDRVRLSQWERDRGAPAFMERSRAAFLIALQRAAGSKSGDFDEVLTAEHMAAAPLALA